MPDRIEILRYSNRHLRPEERYPDWLARTWPRADAIYRTTPTEPFHALFASAVLGEVQLVYCEISAMRWERRIEDIRTSNFDVIIVNMMTKGSAEGDFDGREFREGTGDYHFHDLAKPSDHRSTASRTLSVVIPRAVAKRAFGGVEDLHGQVVSGALADMLIGHAEQVWRALPEMDSAAGHDLGRSFLHILAGAVRHIRAEPARTSSAKSKLRRRAETEIEARLNKPILIADLCKALGVSRKSLAAAFSEDGGVDAYIRALRLERARAALADLERGERIGTIAERFGFYDASHLNRQFRNRYGLAPRDYRRTVAAEQGGGKNLRRRGSAS
jgi:AraC-like DNA-binding protein